MRVIPSGVDVPVEVAAPEQPPHVLYGGRLSEEKGVRELAEAAAGLPFVVVGDGPLRDLFPFSTGFVAHDGSTPPPQLRDAAIVCVPSRRPQSGGAVPTVGGAENVSSKGRTAPQNIAMKAGRRPTVLST